MTTEVQIQQRKTVTEKCNHIQYIFVFKTSMRNVQLNNKIKNFELSLCLDTFCCVEVDSFSHFSMRAKTGIVSASADPMWNAVWK